MQPHPGALALGQTLPCARGDGGTVPQLPASRRVPREHPRRVLSAPLGRGSVSVGTPEPGVTLPLLPRLPWCHLAPGTWPKPLEGSLVGFPACPAASPAGSASSLCHRLGPGTVSPPRWGRRDPPGTARPSTQPPSGKPHMAAQHEGQRAETPSRPPASPPTPRHPHPLHLNPLPLRPLIFHGFQQHDFFQHHFMAGGL